MTPDPTNEAIRHEKCAKKNLDTEKLTITILDVIEVVRIVLLSIKRKIL